ncbi:glycosyltransferase family 39 protein [Streptomyces sp. WMMC500]|uniref:glycosyltransferase family 39 protein n=1 Tax=Streptomyces sp. WMMC500 TaxID=3015154 RepID=UPI00248CD757|nr:glycosyltransferase family 39 protein [Streptomyces sp. WMMC500]WBB62433.1 glycosyltransferase family 39 protein [Streptomyces sp. WMMC500]
MALTEPDAPARRPALTAPRRPHGSGPAPSARPSRRFALIPAVVTLVVGLWGLTRQGSMWRDEAATYDVARRTLPELLRTLGSADAVHGAYYLLMHAVFGVFGDSLAVLRLPSLLAMSAAAAGVALLGGRLAGPRAGLLAGLVFALLPAVQRYGQEGRSYALVCAAVTWATWLFVRARDERAPRLWLGYGAVALSGCLLHEFAVLAVAAHGVTLLVPPYSRGDGRAWTGAAVGVAAALAPLVVVSSRQSEQVAWIGPPGAAALLGYVVPVLVGLLSAALLPAGARRLRALALPLLVLPGGVLLLFSAILPLYVDRYVVYAQAGLALLLGAALDHLWHGRRHRLPLAVVAAAAVAVALVPVGQHLRGPESRRDDLGAVARAVDAHGRPGDGLLYMPGRRRIWQVADPAAYTGLVDLAVRTDPRGSDTLYGVELPAADIRARMLAADRIVALRDPAGEPVDQAAREEVKRDVLRAHFRLCGTTEVHGARVSVFARPGRCDPA